MLHSMELENFKAFGRRVKIPCAPITLIFGQNNAGKSSILHALYLMRASAQHTSDDDRWLVLADKQGSFDLGAFPNVIFGHHTRRKVKIRVVWTSSKPRKSVGDKGITDPFQRFFGKLDDRLLGVEYSFILPPESAFPFADRIDLFVSSFLRPFATFTLIKTEMCRVSGKGHGVPRSALDHLREIVRGKQEFAWSYLSSHPDLWKNQVDSLTARRAEIIGLLKTLDKRTQQIVPDNTNRNLLQFQTRIPDGNLADHTGVVDALRFYTGEISAERLAKRVFGELKSWIASVSLFECELEWPIQLSLFEWENAPPEDPDYHYVSELFGDLLAIETVPGAILSNLKRQLKSIEPLGPTRAIPKRIYTFEGVKREAVGFLGEECPALLYHQPDLLSEVNTWLAGKDKLDSGYRLSADEVQFRTMELFQINVLETFSRGKAPIPWSDVGYGLSQIVPIVIQCLLRNCSILTFEQPELHIHPRLQAALGDLFIHSAQRGNQLIIETHSEHLILRLLRRIRETTNGTLPEGVDPLRPEDLSVLYVKRGKGGSEVVQLPVTPDGDFESDWPEGFFTERERELF
ncbi:MAG: hypothetical protein GHCLOJNM_03641 [bacterium]|nr:hypothetical protein [bacterium]